MSRLKRNFKKMEEFESDIIEFPRNGKRKGSKGGNTSKLNNPNNLYLKDVYPLTENQNLAFKFWDEGKHLNLSGIFGVGKTYIALYLALKTILENTSKQNHLMIIRSSITCGREIGHLPGTLQEKISQYEAPYIGSINSLFGRADAYELCKRSNLISFINTNYLRGQTFENCIIYVDEMQNLTDHEILSAITRCGKNTRVITSGDILQADLVKDSDKNGYKNFIRTTKLMDSFEVVEFGIDDIVRSDFIKEYILARHKLGLM